MSHTLALFVPNSVLALINVSHTCKVINFKDYTVNNLKAKMIRFQNITNNKRTLKLCAQFENHMIVVANR